MSATKASASIGSLGPTSYRTLRSKPLRNTGGVRSTPPTRRSAGNGGLTVLGIGFPDASGATLPGKAGEQAVAFPDKVVVRNAAFGVARKLRFEPIEKEHVVRAFVFSYNGTTRFEIEQCSHVSRHRSRNIDPACRAVRLHERSRVYRVSPDIEGELALADHAGNHRPGVDADPYFQHRQPHFLA